ncbi:MAG: carbohydrate-binding domain-containing protein [Ruminiclostridium sp.]
MNCIRKILSMMTLCMALGGCNGTIGISSTLASAEGSGDAYYTNECSIVIDDEISINGSGAWLDRGRISITEGGVYKLTGRAEKGISIDTAEPVRLVLSGAAVSADRGSGILNGKGKLTIFAAEGTDNSITGGNEEENDGFGVYSNGGITLCGGGKLTVNGERGVFSEEEVEIGNIYLDVTANKKGIEAKTISINGGETFVNTDRNGLCAKESILIRDGKAAAFGAAAEKIAADGGELLVLGEVSGETEGCISFSGEVKAGDSVSVMKNGEAVLELIAPADCCGILFGHGADSVGYSVTLGETALSE